MDVESKVIDTQNFCYKSLPSPSHFAYNFFFWNTLYLFPIRIKNAYNFKKSAHSLRNIKQLSQRNQVPLTNTVKKLSKLDKKDICSTLIYDIKLKIRHAFQTTHYIFNLHLHLHFTVHYMVQ